MTLKTFIDQENNNITGFEIVPEILILNVIVNYNTTYGLNVDTSSIIEGTKLVTSTDWNIQNDILTIGSLSLDINETEVLGFDENI